MTPDSKLRLARQLDALGVDVIEAGCPAASQGDLRGVRAIAEAVRRPVIAALARCHERDIDLAAEALQPAQRKRIHVFIATSEIHLEHKLKIDREACLARARASVRRGRGHAADVEFSAGDATPTATEFLCRVVAAAIEEGAATNKLPGKGGHHTAPGEAALFR